MQTPEHLGGHMGITNMDAAVLDYLITCFRVTSMVDLGCGTGGMVDAAIQRGLTAYGIDGDPALEGNRRIVQHDYTRGPYYLIPAPDLIWCVEFAEHVAQPCEGNWLATLQGARVLLFSAAVPGQGGWHHVNEQPSSYWVDRLVATGWQIHLEATAWVQANATDRYVRAGMVFVRMSC